MKKCFTLFFTFIILSFTLSVPSFATEKKVITLSDDYKYMYFDGSTYTRVDASMLNFIDGNQYELDSYEDTEVYSDDGIVVNTYEYDYMYDIRLNDKQQKEVKKTEIFNFNHDESIFFIEISFYDGSELFIDFIKEDLVEEYNKLITGNTDEYYIDFMWPEDNIISVDKEKFLIGNETKINTWDYEYDYTVYADSETGSFGADIGIILKFKGSYYFYGFMDSDIKSVNDFWELEDEKIDVIELTDDELLKKIKIGEENRQEDDFGYLYNEQLIENVSIVFFVLVFAIAPLAVFVGSLILALKSKKTLYKKLLLATCGISIATIITFIYLAFRLFNI